MQNLLSQAAEIGVEEVRQGCLQVFDQRSTPSTPKIVVRFYFMVNIQKTDGKITMLLMGKSTISMVYGFQ